MMMTVIAGVIALLGFGLLARKGPRGSVFFVAVLMLFASVIIDPGNSRDLGNLLGAMKLIGLIGLILGLLYIVRPPKKNAK